MDGPNPYQPPAAASDEGPSESEHEPDYVLATNGRRFVNFIIDSVGMVIFDVPIGFMLGILGFGDLVESQGFGFVTMALYYVIFEAAFARTPGKMITGCRVVDVDGGPARFTQILRRTASRFFPFEPLSFLFAKQGWHDRWSGTRVVLRPRRPG